MLGADLRPSCSARANIARRGVTLNGIRYTVVGKIRKKDQDSNYSGPDNDKVFVPFAAMARDFPRQDAEPDVVSNIIVAPKHWVVDGLPRPPCRAHGAHRRHRLATRA